MRIFCGYPNDILASWQTTLSSLGQSDLNWVFPARDISFFDLFDNYDPELGIFHLYHLDEKLFRLINEFPDMKVMIDVTDKNINLLPHFVSGIKKLKNEVIIFSCPFKSGMDYELNSWSETFQTIELPMACDPVSFTGAFEMEKYKSNLSYLGPFSESHYDYLIDLEDQSYRIYSWNDWCGLPNNVGIIPFNEIKHMYRSSKQVLFNSYPEVYNILLCGSTPINHFGMSEKSMSREVLYDNTYFDRMSKLMNLLGENTLGRDLLRKKEDYKIGFA